MKALAGIFVAVTSMLAIVLLAACATLGQPPDPAKVRAQIAESREQEIELVRSTVTDPVRAGRLLDLLRERDRLVERHAEQLIVHRQKLAALTADYDTSREDFETLLATFNEQRKAAQKETIDLVAAMKRTATAEEWDTIARFQLKRLDTRQLVYGAAARGG